MQAALRALRAAALALGVMLAGAGAAETVLLSRAQAIQIGRAAYLEGNPGLANAIARQLIQSDPRDVEALLLLSASEEALGRPASGYLFGQRAWEAARAQGRPKALRYEIARQTAHAAMSGDRLRVAGRWLRLSMDVAPAAAERRQSAADLSQVSAATPLTFSGSFQVSPTDNVNNGASTGLLVVDDTVIGGISGWSVAQPGQVASARITATRNLGVTASGKARNALTFGLTGTMHWLTHSGQNLNPHDLDMWTASAGWVHEIALPDHDRPMSLTTELGQSWYAGRAYAPSLRVAARYPLTPTDQGGLDLSASVERQWLDAPSGTVDGASLSLDGGRPVEGLKARLGYGIGGTFLRSDWSNSTYDSFSAYLSLTPDRRIGPVETTFRVGGSWRRYQDYSLGFANVTRGRTDQGLWVEAAMSLPDVSYRGLSPMLTLRRQKTDSNISKYQTDETALYFGLAADF